MNYTQYFGFKTEPFNSEIQTKNLLKLPSMVSVKERIDYVLRGGVLLVTGDVGSGKSTALRWSENHFHPSQHLFINIIASGGTLIEFYKQLCWGVDLDVMTGTRTSVMKKFKSVIEDIAQTKKQKIVIIVDEAHLLRAEVFSELHTLTQFKNDSKNYFSIVLAGLSILIDKMTYRTSLPLASRVIARTHLVNLDEAQLSIYLDHHLSVAGINNKLFSQQAITAIYQGSAGILRKANHLARGGLIAASAEKEQTVSAEHIRIAATELM